MGEKPGILWIRAPWISSIPSALGVITSNDELMSVKNDALCMYLSFWYYKRWLKENDFPIQCSLGVGHKHNTTAIKIHSEILRDSRRESGGILSWPELSSTGR